MSDPDRVHWEDEVAAAVLVERQHVDITERDRLLPTFMYVAEIVEEIGSTPAQPSSARARIEVERRLPWRFMRDLFRPELPTASAFARKRAELAAERVLERWRRQSARYGEVNCIPLDAAPGYAFMKLSDLGERMNAERLCGSPVRNPEAFLTHTIESAVQRDMQTIIKHARPRAYLLYTRTRKFEKQLRQLHPALSPDECTDQAAAKAVEELDRLGGCLDRVVYGESFDAAVADLGYELVVEEDLADAIQRIVSRGLFTDFDRDTWNLWREAGFSGHAIDWVGKRKLRGNTGPQRLLTLLRKLKDHLGRGFFGYT
ncbi:MAG TPA: hypothetical protein VGY13_04880 [Solirubrobacteraceae bacterium]|nr:hypothetical protein [Solirubrobacteraceae bacterium]